MASPGDVLPLDYQHKSVDALSELEKESPVGTEQLKEQSLSTDPEHPSTAASSTGSTPMPAPAVEFPVITVDKATEGGLASQKQPKIVPRGIKRIKPLRQKEGVFIQPWEFKFELLSELKLSHNKKSGNPVKKQPLPAKKKTIPTVCAVGKTAQPTTSTFATINGDHACSSIEVDSPLAAGTGVVGNKQHAKLHTTRVEFLLKKYLQDPSDVLINSEQTKGKSELADQLGAPTTSKAVLSPRLKKRPENFNKRTTKSIMQVKGEQDAAVRALQHAPREFHAKPIPLDVAVPHLEKRKPSIELVLTSTERKTVNEISSITLSPRGSISAKSVPPSTSEPRYALHVADAVLRRYSAQGNQPAEESVADELKTSLSCPPGLDLENEAAVHLQREVAGDLWASPLQRPQSARPRRRSQSPSGMNTQLPDIVEEAPEQLKEFY